MAKVTVDFQNCKGCGLCVAACPKKILRLGSVSNNKGYYVVECTDPEDGAGQVRRLRVLRDDVSRLCHYGRKVRRAGRCRKKY